MDACAKAALAYAAEREGDGVVLDDSYALQEYIHRRHAFLGKLPSSAGNRRIYQDVLIDSECVYRSPAARLSVQAVRESELAFQIYPLLPLPTTSNTQSIDSFRSYSNMPQPDVVDEQTRASPPVGQSLPFQEGTSQTIESQSIPSLQECSSPTLHNSDTEIALHLTPATDSTEHTHVSDAEPPSPIHLGFGLPGIRATHKTSSVAAAQQTSHDAVIANGALSQSAPFFTSPPQYVQNIIANFNNPTGRVSEPHRRELQQQVMTQPVPLPNGTVSALKNRPIYFPVKVQPWAKKPASGTATVAASTATTGAKQPFLGQPSASALHDSNNEDVALNSEGPANYLMPHKGIIQTSNEGKRGTKRPADSDAEQDTIAVQAGPSSKRLKINGPAAPTQGKAAPKPKKAKSANSTRTLPYEAVITGQRLPKWRKEAEDAVSTRYERLLAAHRAQKPTARHPDLGPEFFDMRNLTRAEKESHETVRCLCGARTDAKVIGEQWVGCDAQGCQVWQHLKCMGEPAVEATVNDVKYFCHRCDPWKHRKTLQKVRRGEGLV